MSPDSEKDCSKSSFPHFSQFAQRSLRHRLRSHIHRSFSLSFPRSDESDQEPVSLLVPLAEKDLNLARISLPEILQQVNHPVSECILVSPPSKLVHDFASQIGATHLVEDDVFPDLIRECEAALPANFRRGWMRQQIIKLSFPHWLEADRVVVFDADTFPVRPLPFWNPAGQQILYSADEYNPHYAATNARLFPNLPRHSYSFVAHTMGFEKSLLRKMQQELESIHSKHWLQAIYHSLDSTQRACFSEFELYGNYAVANAEKSPEIRYWYNKKKPLKEFSPSPQLHKAGKYNTISHHQPS